MQVEFTKDEQKKILLFDMCNWVGHHEVYFKNILLTLLENNYLVYAVCQDNIALKKWIEELNLKNCHVLDPHLSFVDRLGYKLLAVTDDMLKKISDRVIYKYSSISALLFIRNILKHIGQDSHVFIAHGDSAIPAVPQWFAELFLPKSWMTLMIQPSYLAAISLGKEKSRQRFAAEQLFSLPSCKAVFSLHPVYQSFYNKRFKQQNFLIFPELVDVQISEHSEIADKVRYLASGRKIVSIIGSLLPKRNLILFLEAAQKLNPAEYFVLVVGQISREYFSAPELEYIQVLVLALSSNSYIDLDYYIPEEIEFNRLLSISDVIYLQYKDHSCSSNILSKSIELRKPVIINNGYLMKKVVETYDWQAIAPEDADLIAAAIVDVAHNFKINEDKYSQFLKAYDSAENKAVVSRALYLL